MNGLLFFITFFTVVVASAQTVQVPEACINQVSPCLIHTAEADFQFDYDGQRVTLLKEAILKITFDEKKSHFELLDGRIVIKKVSKNLKTLSIDGQAVKTGWLMVSRSANTLNILDMKSFAMNRFESDGAKSAFKATGSDFVDKNEFVGFTKFFFHNLRDYKSFLAIQAHNWKREFEAQNNSQTKVLMRTIASEQKKARAEAEKNSVNANQAKKARELFFYRTFER